MTCFRLWFGCFFKRCSSEPPSVSPRHRDGTVNVRRSGASTLKSKQARILDKRRLGWHPFETSRKNGLFGLCDNLSMDDYITFAFWWCFLQFAYILNDECTVQIVKECDFLLIHPQLNHPFHQVKDLWQLWHQGRRSRWRAPCSQSGTSQQQQSMGRFWKPYPNAVVYGIIFSCFAGSPSLKPSAQWRGVLLNLSSMPGASRISLEHEFSGDDQLPHANVWSIWRAYLWICVHWVALWSCNLDFWN